MKQAITLTPIPDHELIGQFVWAVGKLSDPKNIIRKARVLNVYQPGFDLEYIGFMPRDKVFLAREIAVAYAIHLIDEQCELVRDLARRHFFDAKRKLNCRTQPVMAGEWRTTPDEIKEGKT